MIAEPTRIMIIHLTIAEILSKSHEITDAQAKKRQKLKSDPYFTSALIFHLQSQKQESPSHRGLCIEPWVTRWLSIFVSFKI